ncbi:bacterio-opsin activator domain-containing protein [Halomicroarcula sp. GCM10025710]
MADEDGTEASALLHRTVAVAADVGEGLTRAATGTEIEQTVCDRLADTEGFRFAWTAERTGDGLTQSCGAGLGSERIQAQLGEFADDLGMALEDHETQVVERSDGALAFVPVTGDTTVSGVLALGTEAPVDDTERKLLTALGAQVGHAVTAIERKRLLLADVVTELEFDCSDATAFTVGLSGELDCSVDLSGVVPVSGQSLLYYLVVDGAPAADVLAYAVDDPTVTDARLIENYGDGALVEVVVSAAPALTLVESGARVCDLSVEGGAATILVDLPGEADLRPVVDAVVDAYPDTTLTAKREAERPVQTDVGFRERFADRLTDRQETVLRAAYHSGYFEWPRGTTAEELADSLDVASPTLHNHLRKAQQALLTEFFTETPSRRPPSLGE